MHKKMNTQYSVKQQAGFTLIEAMIALLVFSVGLLGLAGMQMSGLQNNHNSLMRTYAIQNSYDIAERIRSRINNANPLAAVASWNDDLAVVLPKGQGRVVPNPLTPGSFDITVFWDEDRTGASGLNCNPANPADLRCITMTVVP